MLTIVVGLTLLGAGTTVEVSMKFDYKFVNVKLQWGWSAEKPKQNYHEIVEQHAADGWRLVQIFAPATTGVGKASYFELIFERPVE